MSFDPGLQPERTALAWRRTSLAVACSGLVALRVLPGSLGAVGVIGGCGGVITGAVLAYAAHRRTVRTTAGLLGGGPVLSGGMLPLILAIVVSGGAGAALTAAAAPLL